MNFTTFIVLDLKRIKNTQEIEVSLQIGESHQAYTIKREKIGFTVPGELQNLLMQRAERSRNFIELVDRVYEGNNDVVFPADMSYF